MDKKWYQLSGTNGDVIISTRVRLARNLAQYPFSCRISEARQQEINRQVKDILTNGDLHYIDMAAVSDIKALSMVERHLVSPDFIQNRAKGGLILSGDQSTSVMLGEEDHIRIQVLSPGFELQRCYSRADQLDDILDARLTYAFDEKLGFLTQCPTNLGTGLRASVMMHLPAIEKSGGMQQIIASVSKIGLTIRGAYGEGSSPIGSMYQISNQVTLDISESSAINNLKSISSQIMNRERTLRASICRQQSWQDAIFRSYGILKYARVMGVEECMKHLSLLRLGVSAGLIEDVSLDTINALNVETKPASLLLSPHNDIDVETKQKGGREVARATIIREHLNG